LKAAELGEAKDVTVMARMHRAASVLADGRMLVAGG
jgi:hypothetical protein